MPACVHREGSQSIGDAAMLAYFKASLAGLFWTTRTDFIAHRFEDFEDLMRRRRLSRDDEDKWSRRSSGIGGWMRAVRDTYEDTRRGIFIVRNGPTFAKRHFDGADVDADKAGRQSEAKRKNSRTL